MWKILISLEKIQEFNWNFYNNIKSHSKAGLHSLSRRYILGKNDWGVGGGPPSCSRLSVNFSKKTSIGKYRNPLTKKKLTLSVFLYPEEQVEVSCIFSILFL